MENVGDVMSEARLRAFKAIAIGAGILVYAGMLVYSGVHNYTLMSRGVPADLLIWAIVGVVSLEVTAAAMPLALHFWCHAPLQRYAAFAFYAIDLAIIFINVILDFAINAGSDLPAWSAMWLFFVVPATPVIAGFGWTMLFLLDPSSRQREVFAQLQASTIDSLSARIVVAARQADVNAIVEEAAQNMTYEIIARTLGPAPARRKKLPAQAEDENPTLPAPSKKRI